MDTIFSIAVIIGIIALLNSYNEQKKKIQILKNEYEKALRGRNKATALNAGRNYYSALRRKYGLNRMAMGTSLTIADETTIMNDISAMKTK